MSLTLVLLGLVVVPQAWQSLDFLLTPCTRRQFCTGLVQLDKVIDFIIYLYYFQLHGHFLFSSMRPMNVQDEKVVSENPTRRQEH